MLRKEIIYILLMSVVLLFAGCTNKETEGKNMTNNVDSNQQNNSTLSNIKDVELFIKTAISKKENMFSNNEVSSKVIGKFDGTDVIEYNGEYNTFEKVEKELGKFFTSNMIELELRKMGYANIDGKIGIIQASGEGNFYIDNDSKYKFISNENSKKIVEIETFNDFSDKSSVQYTLEKLNEGEWKITDERGKYNDVSTPIKMKYFIGWNNIKSSSNLESFTPDLVLDGNLDTAWVEASKSNGISEWIKLEGTGEKEVSGIEINNGYSKSNETYNSNNRVKKIKIEFSDGTSLEKELNDNSLYELQKVDFGKKVKTKYVKLTILDIYKGDKFQDTCISEIRVF